MNPTRLLVLRCWAKRGPGLARFPAPIGGDRGWPSVRRKVGGALFAEREELATRRARREARWRDSVTPRVALSPGRRAQTGWRIGEVLSGLIGATGRGRRDPERMDRYVAGVRQLIVQRPSGEKPHALPFRAVLQKGWPQAHPVAAPEWPPLTVSRAASALPGQEVQP